MPAPLAGRGDRPLIIPGQGSPLGSLLANADCSAANNCGTDVFTPSPVTFGECSAGGCATTLPMEFLSGCDEGGCQASVPGFVDSGDGGVVALPTGPRVTGEIVATLPLRAGGNSYEAVIMKTEDGTHYAVRPSDGHAFGRVKKSSSKFGGWNPKGGDFKAPPPEIAPNVATEVFKSYKFVLVEDLAGLPPRDAARKAVAGADIDSIPMFADGYASGDGSAWSSIDPNAPQEWELGGEPEPSPDIKHDFDLNESDGGIDCTLRINQSACGN